MKKSGFTLLELILYISIAGVTLGIMVYSLNQIYKLNTANNVNSTVASEGEKIANTLRTNIKLANTIATPNPNSLLITFEDLSTKTFSLSGENFQIVNTPSNLTQTLNLGTVVISDLAFSLVNNSNPTYKEGVKFTFKVKYKESNLATDSFEYDSEQTFTDTLYLDKFTDKEQNSLYLMETSIKSNNKLSLWLDANTINLVKDVNNKVSTWTDRSNSNRVVNQTTFINQPTFVPNILNGFPVIRFDGTDEFLNFDGNFLANTKYHIYIVGKRNDVNPNFWIAGDSNVQNENLNIGYFSDTTLRFSQLNNDIDQTVSAFDVNTAKFNIFGFSNNASGKNIEENGLSINGSPNQVNLTSFNNATIGRYITTEYLNGDIAEILIFNNNLAPTEKDIVLDYLNTKYDLYLSNPDNLYLDISN